MFQKGIFVINLRENIELFKNEIDNIIKSVNSCVGDEEVETLKLKSEERKQGNRTKHINSILLIFDNYDYVLKEKQASF